MDKIAIFLLAVVIGHWAHRTPKHYSYSSFNTFPNHQNPNSNLINSPSTISFLPYSNTYPFYALWNNGQNRGRNVGRPIDRSLSGGVSNQIATIPRHHNAQWTQYNNGQNPAQSPLVVPFATISEGYDNIWNFDVNSLRPKINHISSPASVLQEQPHIASSRIDEIMGSKWNLPLKSYDDIRRDAVQGFQRGHVESSSHSRSPSAMQLFFPHQGFTRGHIESRPDLRGAIVGLRAADGSNLINSPNSYKTGFSRGAVESSSGGRVIRYDAASDDVPATNNKVVCYYASWSYYRKDKGSFSPENVDPTLCTHVVYAFANLDKSRFSIKESDPQLDKDKQFYKRFTSLKERNPKLKVLLGLGGWSDSGDDKYSVLANSPQHRQKFAVETAKYLKDRNFDGLSLDWHYPKCWQSQCELGPDSDKNAFTELVKELQSVFKPQGLVLSATLSGYKEVVDLAYDIPALSQNLDLMNVMAYDYHGAWEAKTGHLAPLFAGPPSFDPYPSYNVNYTIQYYINKGADRSKLIVGVPMYGQSFHLSNAGDSSYGSEAIGPGMPGEFTQQPGMLAYYEICSRVKNKQWTTKYDRTGSWGPYAYKDTEWVGYDDSDFLIRKARYVKQQKLGGMLAYTMDLDDFQNVCCMGSHPLLRTIAKELLEIEYNPSATDCTPPVVPKPSVEVTTTKPGQVLPTTEHLTSSTWWPQTTSTPTSKPSSPSSLPDSISQSTEMTSDPDPTTISPLNPPDPSIVNETTTNSPPVTVVFICQQVNGSVITPVSTTPSSSVGVTRPPDNGGSIPGNTCDNTWVYKPDITDCSMYHQCNDGKAFKKMCPPGLHWNQYAHACDWPEYAKCGGSSTTSEGTTNSPTTRPTIWSTTTTRTTTTPQPPRPTRPTTTQAPWTQATWSQTQSTTYRPSGQRCTPGEYSPGPSCDRYYVCVDGTQMVQSCGPGLHWNAQKILCDWPNSAMCQTQQNPAPGPGDNDIPNPDTIKLPKNCQQGEYSGDDEDCAVYYQCNHGHPLQFRCQEGLHWNQNAKACDWPASAGCRISGGGGGGSQPQPQPHPQPYPTTTTTEAPIFTDPPTTTSTTRPSTTPRPTTPRPTARPTPTTSLPSTTTTSSPWTSTTMGSEIVVPEPITGSDDYMIVCYFTNWAWYRPGTGKYKPEDINPHLCTHIVYGFAVLDYTELVLKPHDSWADFDNHFYEQVTAFKKGGTKVTLAIGGWNDSQGDKYSRLVNHPAARKKFINHAIEFVKKNNFDGLDLDWEYPKCWQVDCEKGPDSDKPNFATFVRELKEAFQPHGLLLSAAVSPSKIVVDKGYDVPTIAKYLDFISVMTYDFHGQWDKKTGHVAPLYFHEEDDFAYFNANYSIHYWMSQGAHKKKLVLGMPLYGQSFTLTNPNEHGLNAPSTGGGIAGEYSRQSGFLTYYEICKHVQKDGWTVVEDETGAMGPYAYKGNQWVSYDDVAMIRKKSQLIRDLDLGGGMIWALDLDDFRNSCGQGAYPLLTTIKNVLGKPRIGTDHEPEILVTSRPSTTTKRSTTTTSKRPTTSTTTTRRTTTTTRRPTTTTVATRPTTRPTTKRPPNKIVGTVETEDAVIVGEQEGGANNLQKPTTVRPAPPPHYPVGKQDCASQPFKPHETDCNKYYQCLFGNYVEYKCAPGTYWNKDHCDWTCGQEPSGQGPSPGQSSTTASSWQTTTTAMRPTPQTTPKPTTTNRPWTPAPSTPSTTMNWNPTTLKPSTSTSWEWKPPIITTTTINPVEVPDSEFMVVCYFTNWAWYRQGIGKYKPEDIDYNLCTHIAYGFAVLNPSTLEIRTHDSWADVDNQFYKQVADLKSKGKKVVIAIGGWNDSLGDKYSRLVRDAAARRKFIQNVIDFIQKYNFDGLDLDWEYPKCWQTDCKLGPADDKENFATFTRELKEAFTPHGYLLSSAVSPSKTIIDEGYDVPIINKYLDWIAVMTYDYHGQWDKKTGHVAPMYHHEDSDNFYFNSNYTINYWLSKGADKKKIVMGMPMYGQSFTLTQPSNHDLNAPSMGGGTAGEFTRAAGFLSYYEICKNIKGQGWTVVQDETGAIGPYAYKGNQWVSFDDVAMIRRKSQYIKDIGLGGGMIWALDLDDFRNVCGCEKHPLLKTINRVLRNYPEPDPKCSL